MQMKCVCSQQNVLTSLCRLNADPADLMDLPVASFADCRPPAFALSQDTLISSHHMDLKHRKQLSAKISQVQHLIG